MAVSLWANLSPGFDQKLQDILDQNNSVDYRAKSTYNIREGLRGFYKNQAERILRRKFFIEDVHNLVSGKEYVQRLERLKKEKTGNPVF